MPQRRDEVVHQPELGRLPVDVGRDEEEAGLGAQHRVGRQQILAGAPLRTQHGGGAGGEGGQEDEEEQRADQRGDHIHGYSSAATQKEERQQSELKMSKNDAFPHHFHLIWFRDFVVLQR